jgi:AraC-like DNA-binding protein
MTLVDGLSFGWRTATLTIIFVQLLLLAGALPLVLQNRAANRTMAALLLILAGMITPWMIGFAGFYDKWMWLTFAPFQISLAVAPLFYLYAHALVSGAWPKRGFWHLVPATVQALFLTGSFLLPFETKMRWADIVYRPLDIVTGIGIIIGLGCYSFASFRLLRSYRAALAGARSDGHRYAARWLERAIASLALLMLVWTIFLVWDWLVPLGYRGLMGLYVAIGAFALYLGIEAWRHAALPFPPLASLRASADTLPPPRDWKALGESWAERVRAEDWATDPELSLASLARKLGTNTGHLSRAINEGLGIGFSAFVNNLRAERVADLIAAGRKDDLLSLALEAGFSSKASFNRAFSTRFGMAPSTWRQQHGGDGSNLK